MAKTIKHENILRPNPGMEAEGYNYFEFPCRGCTMRYRRELWENFVSSIGGWMNRSIDNSYLTFEEEPNNSYDPNAIMVVCRGEFFGTAGYVGKEFTLKIKEILNACESYRIDMIDEEDVGKKEIKLIVTWK